MRRQSILVLVALVFVVTGISEANLDTGLIGHWPLNGNANDLSGYGHDGTIYGAILTADRLGNPNGAYRFDGIDDYIALPDNEPIWLPEQNFTLSLWAYCDKEPGTTSKEVILDLNTAGSSNPDNELGYTLQRIEQTGNLIFGMTTTTNSDENLYSNTPLSKNRWYNIVAVRNGTIQSIYIDGQLDISRTCSPDPITFVGGYDNDTVNIGKFSRLGNPSSYHFDGLIDDVRIYNRALSGQEIQQLYMVPEPATLLLLGLGAVMLKRRNL